MNLIFFLVKKKMLNILSSDISLSEVKKIIHISDIHIRLFRRKEEYLYCFHELYKKIGELEKGDKVKVHYIIVITGDLLHSKLELSPECEILTFDFLTNLSKLYPTFLIAGNHDALLNNRDRPDSISSILYKRTIPNFFYLKNTGIYEYNNIHFYVDSLLDNEKVNMIEPIDKDKIKIALYHGQIYGWKNVKGYISECGEKYIEEFKGMDYVLLGDIHNYQYMSKENPISAYPGSLISQNFGESDPNHGMLVWNLNDKKQIFYPIENPYRYQDVFILSRDILQSDLKNYSVENIILPPKGNVRIYGMENDLESRMILQSLQKLWNDISFTYKEKKFIENSNIEKNKSSVIELNENKLIEEYIKNRVEKEYFDETLHQVMTYWTDNVSYSNLNWEIVSIEFSNLFGYGQNNRIQFPFHSRYNTIGIFGENSVGKSTIIDIITLLLFDKVTRFSHGQSIPNEVIHFEEKEGKGCLKMRIGHEIYTIEKNYKRLSNQKIKLVTKLFCISNGISKELTDEQRNKTNQMIKDIIGGFEMFIYNHSFLQQREQNFREFTSSNKKKFLYELNGYSLFEKIEKEKKECIKEMDINKKLLMKQLSEKSDIQYKEEIQNLSSYIKEINNTILSFKEKDSEIDTEINNNYKNLSNSKIEDISKETESIEIFKKEIEKEEDKYLRCIEYKKKWDGHFFIQLFQEFYKEEIFIEWKSKEKIEWERYYAIISKERNIKDINERLENLYRQDEKEEIIVSDKILSLYSLKDKEKVDEQMSSFQNDTKLIDKELKRKYNELNFSIDNINSIFYNENKEEKYNKFISLERKRKELEIKFNSYKSQDSFIKNENVTIFFKEWQKYQISPFYQSYSFFYKGNYKKWTNLEDVYKKISSIGSLKRESNELDDRKEELRSNIPNVERNEIISNDIYKKYVEEVKIQWYKCPNCSFTLNSTEWDLELKKIEDVENNLYLVQSEIRILETNIEECNFIPNPTCNVCIDNPSYKSKILNRKKLEEKNKEWKEYTDKNDKLIQKLYKKMTKRDVHCKKFKELKPCLENLLLFKREKLECMERSEKEKIIYDKKSNDILHFKLNEKKIDSEKQIRKIDIKNIELKKEIDNLLYLVENSKIIEFLKTEWKWKHILPNKKEEFLKVYENFQTEFLDVEKEYKKVIAEEEKSRLEWEDFEKNWEKDLITVEQIKELEKKEEDFKNYLLWIKEIDKYEKKKNLSFLREQILFLKEEERKYYQWKEYKKLFEFIEKIWLEPYLWNINGNDIKEQLDKNIVFIENMGPLLIKKKEELEKKNNIFECKLLDQKINENLELLKKKKEDIKNLIHLNEESYIELKMKLKSIEDKKIEREQIKQKIQIVEEQKKKETILLNLIDKDGLPLYLLKKKIEPMEKQMNELIRPFLPEKEISFFIDQKNIEFGSYNKDSKVKKLCNYFGGMESFIIDLVLKITFSKFGNVPRCNFFIIDEGISVLDQEKIYNISSLFNFLLTMTPNLLLISHIPQIKDFVTKEMIIEKKDNKSFIDFSI